MTDQPKRDEKGRFTEGGPGGPGRKSRAAEEASLAQLKKFYNNGKLTEFIEAGHKYAVRGDAAMWKAIAAYLWGLPAQSVDVLSDSIVRVIVQHERRQDNNTGAAPNADAGEEPG